VISRLTNVDLNYVPEQPVFVSLVANDLSGLDGELAGYDADFLSFASALANEPDEGGMMDGFLTASVFNPGDVDAVTWAPIATEYASFTPGVDALLHDYDGGLAPTPGPTDGKPTPPPPPSAPTPPPPPIGGGGGPIIIEPAPPIE
jgi:hypothetical protein